MWWSMIWWLLRPDPVHKLVEGQYTAEKAPAGRPHTGANDNDPCSDPMDHWPRKSTGKDQVRRAMHDKSTPSDGPHECPTQTTLSNRDNYHKM